MDRDQVTQHQKAVLLPDLREVPVFYANNLDVARPEWESFLCVPLVANDRVQGAVGLFRQRSAVEDHSQLAFYEALGHEVGVAIQNARLFEQVRNWQEQLESLSRRQVELQERERRHIARELHDEVGQLLTGLRLSVEMAIRRPDDRGEAPLSEILELVTELIGRVREISLDLRPAMLDDLGLLPTLLWHFDRYRSQTGVQVVFEHKGLDGRFPPAIETAAYRVVQESLTNVARHAHVREVTVTLWALKEHLTVEVSDRGCGFNPENVWKQRATAGLVGMQERTVLLGGRLSVCSVPGRGTQVLALLPIVPSPPNPGEEGWVFPWLASQNSP